MFAAQYCVTPTKRPGIRLPEKATSFLRDVKRRSLRVKRSKSLVINPPGADKRKSDSFVNSQEWTLSRGVPDIRLGIVGSLSSGKSALVHRYLTGSYMQEESPEGGRFKKEVVVDGHSYLLLIRDEGGPPELQFTSWVDAVIFVFSLENEASFSAIYNYYVKMSQFRNMQEIPLILVGTQDAISESQPRVIDDARARKLANDLKRCAYYETCATYGLNVERVFQDACQKLTVAASARAGAAAAAMSSRPGTPSLPASSRQDRVVSQTPNFNPGYHPTLSPGGGPASNGGHPFQAPSSPTGYYFSAIQKENIRPAPPPPPPVVPLTPGTNNSYHYPMYHDDHTKGGPRAIMVPPPMAPPAPHAVGSSNTGTLSSGSSVLDKFAVPTVPSQQPESQKELPTPSSTPTSSRKNRRRSNLFTPSKKQQQAEAEAMAAANSGGKLDANGGPGGPGAWSLGSGRSIPVRQGILYKKTSNTFSKDWKKKYVTLCDDGRMTYHPSLNDYMSNVHGKEIPLQCVTVKVPGQKPRGSRTVVATNASLNSAAATSNNHSDHVIKSNGAVSSSSSSKNGGEKVMLTGFEIIRDETTGGNGDNNNDTDKSDQTKAERTTPNVKKRHGGRHKGKDHLKNGVKTSSSSVGYVADGGGGGLNGSEGDSEGNFEFHIVSLDNKQWHFEAGSAEERDEWVTAIEQQILNSLQGIESSKAKGGHSASVVDLQAMKAIKSDIPGNDKCVDCDSPNPDWASINLGVLICIECSGVHRKLGSHISRVRSLDLDEWPPGHLSVMTALGNRVANSVWEARLPTATGRKPGPNSSQEDKERFIMMKYEKREFLAPVSAANISYASHLFNAICRSDVKSVAHVLTHCTNDDVNAPVSPRDDRCPLHVASSLGNLAIVQLLIWSNANVKTVDHDGRTCVSYARSSSSGNSDLIDLLLNNGCPDVSTGGTLPRRKNSLAGPGAVGGGRKAGGEGVMEKVTSSVL